MDYILIDFASEARRRWLTSRLYILSLLLTLVDRTPCLVFVEEAASVRRKFIGLAYPSQVRWGLARAYGWLEAAAAHAYANSLGAAAQFDPTTGFLADWPV